MTTTTTPDFDLALTKFLAVVNKYIADYSTNNLPNIQPDYLTATYGPKYVKIVRNDPYTTGHSVFCFIERSTGNVLKAASWKAPAKGVRGSIFAEKFEDYGVNVYGVNSLR